MANLKFTKRLGDAVRLLLEDASLGLARSDVGSLYAPVFRSGAYVWAKVMDSDGLLIAARPVKSGEGGSPSATVELLIGVVLQSEEATSQTKPNPLGKASLAHIANGVWVDLTGEGRRRLDRVFVVFVVPKGVAPKYRKTFATAKRNVENAAILFPDVATIEIDRGLSAAKIAPALKKAIRPYFKGPGKPKGTNAG